MMVTLMILVVIPLGLLVTVPTELNFSGSSGTQAPIPDNPEVINFVKLFFNDSDFEVLTTKTNRYAKSYLENAPLCQFSRLKRWPAEGITVSDMKCFIACTIAMGLTVQEDLVDYWSTDPVMLTLFYPSTMSQDFFFNILTFFHLSDNANYVVRGQNGYNPLAKLPKYIGQV